MSEPIVQTWRRQNMLRAWRRRLPTLAVVLGLIAILGGGIAWLALSGSGLVASPASVQGPAVRAQTAGGGDRVFLITSQWRTYRTRMTPTGTSYSRLFVDVWGFDPANAAPVWRQRLADDRAGVNMGRQLLGVQGGILWLFDGRSLVGLSPKNGARVADNGTFEAANPQLRGVMPTDARYVRFDPQGLSFTAADGRDWRLTGEGAATRPDGPRLSTDAQRADPQPGIALPTRNAGGNGTWSFYTRGINIGGRQWLGLLAPPEAEKFDRVEGIGGIDPQTYPRTRLWVAKIGRKPSVFGSDLTIDNLRPLPESPEFLTAGLLQDGRCCRNIPILVFKPDGVLVLHRDRLGPEGRLKLTRVSGPLGKPVWSADLPVKEIEAVMPGETSVALIGRREEPPLFRRRDGRTESVDQLVSVDLATGKLSAYGFRIRPTDPQDLPASSTKLD
jgi:hypothetical protein